MAMGNNKILEKMTEDYRNEKKKYNAYVVATAVDILALAALNKCPDVGMREALMCLIGIAGIGTGAMSIITANRASDLRNKILIKSKWRMR